MFELAASDFDGRNNGLDIPRSDMATKSLPSPDISLLPFLLEIFLIICVKECSVLRRNVSVV